MGLMKEVTVSASTAEATSTPFVIGASQDGAEHNRLCVSIHNGATGAIETLTIERQVTPNGPWVPYLGEADLVAAGDSDESIPFVGTNMPLLPAGEDGAFDVVVGPVLAVRIKVKLQTGSGPVGIQMAA
jgi:hypothetical protein